MPMILLQRKRKLPLPRRCSIWPRIVAPFAGTVTQAELSIGDQVSQGSIADEPSTSSAGASVETTQAWRQLMKLPPAQVTEQATPEPTAVAPCCPRILAGDQVGQGAFASRVDDLSI